MKNRKSVALMVPKFKVFFFYSTLSGVFANEDYDKVTLDFYDKAEYTVGN